MNELSSVDFYQDGWSISMIENVEEKIIELHIYNSLIIYIYKHCVM